MQASDQGQRIELQRVPQRTASGGRQSTAMFSTMSVASAVATYHVLAAGNVAGSVVAATSRVELPGPYPPSSRSAAHHSSVCLSRKRRSTLVQPPGSSGLVQGTSRAASGGECGPSAGPQLPREGRTAST